MTAPTVSSSTAFPIEGLRQVKQDRAFLHVSLPPNLGSWKRDPLTTKTLAQSTPWVPIIRIRADPRRDHLVGPPTFTPLRGRRTKSLAGLSIATRVGRRAGPVSRVFRPLVSRGRERFRRAKLEHVVGCGDELPFGLAGAEASPLEAVNPAEELGVGEDRFGDLLAPPVERLPLGRVEDRFDPVGFLATGRPERARPVSTGGPPNLLHSLAVRAGCSTRDLRTLRDRFASKRARHVLHTDNILWSTCGAERW